MTTRGAAPARRMAGWLPTIALGIATLAMLAARERLDKAHVALVYLIVVLVGSARSGRRAGFALGGAAFLLFNFFFLPPYNTLVIADPLDWLVLVAFLATGAVATELLHRQREQAALAEARTRELDEIATLGAETLKAARAAQALEAIALVIARMVGADRCQIFVWRDGGAGLAVVADTAREAADSTAAVGPNALLAYVVEHQRPAIERDDSTISVAEPDTGGDPVDVTARAFAAPLVVRGRPVGAVRVSAVQGIPMGPERRRVLAALSYYAALGLDRLRLEGSEETAEQLRRADRLKDALLASVSHDLRTPLTTIKAIAHDVAASGHLRAAVIEEEADRLSELVDGLLEMSQLDAGAVPVQRELNTIDDLVGAALQRSEAALKGHPVQVTFDNPEMPVGRFDLGLTLRVLTNVLENAAKYSASKAPIAINVGRVPGAITVAVSDSGPGIPPTERERIFEPFYRLPGTTADVRGAGLGLSIARRLARAQGGDLIVAASGPQPGATFVLTIPIGETLSAESGVPTPQ